MSRIKRHVSPGLVLGVIAIVIALGGSAIAVKASKVGGKDLKTLKTRTATVTINPNTSGQAIALCQGKEKFISGGTRFSVTQGAGVDFAHKEGNGYLARGFNFLATPVVLTTEAYCIKR